MMRMNTIRQCRNKAPICMVVLLSLLFSTADAFQHATTIHSRFHRNAWIQKQQQQSPQTSSIGIHLPLKIVSGGVARRAVNQPQTSPNNSTSLYSSAASYVPPSNGTTLYTEPTLSEVSASVAIPIPSQRPDFRSWMSSFREAYRFESSTMRNQVWFVCALTAAAGFMDVYYTARYGCFVNMMTGNTIKAGVGLANGRLLECFCFLCLVFSYLVGTGWAQVKTLQMNKLKEEQESAQKFDDQTNNYPYERSTPSNPKILAAFPICRAIAPAIWMLFAAGDVFGLLGGSNLYLTKFASAGCASMAYGLLNTVAAACSGATIVYALTGALTKMGSGFVNLWVESSSPSKRVEYIQQILYSSRVVAMFGVGSFLAIRTFHFSGIAALSMQNACKSLPVNTFIGTFYAALLLWYGRVGKKPKEQ